MNVCDKCLNDCKCNTPISCCNNYRNPNWRQFDWRCRICKKKVPNRASLCTVCSAWHNLLRRFGGLHFSCLSSFRENIRKYVRKIKEREKNV